MITVKFAIPYDGESNYAILVDEKDKILATELINAAYEEFLENDAIYDFREHAEEILSSHYIDVEFSFWNPTDEL